MHDWGGNKADGAPVLGDNIYIGIGAKILGGVHIANNIVIGANAVVTNSFHVENITIAGVPARQIKNDGNVNWKSEVFRSCHDNEV